VNKKINLFFDDLRAGPCNGWNENDGPVGWENWMVVRSVENAKWLLEMGVVADLAMDHDMGDNSDTGELNPDGSALVKWMIETETWPSGVITIHSCNYEKAQHMKAVDADMV